GFLGLLLQSRSSEAALSINGGVEALVSRLRSVIYLPRSELEVLPTKNGGKSSRGRADAGACSSDK
ncbi:unnamed protein product, partial [Amoebophrya sp. A25]